MTAATDGLRGEQAQQADVRDCLIIGAGAAGLTAAWLVRFPRRIA